MTSRPVRRSTARSCVGVDCPVTFASFLRVHGCSRRLRHLGGNAAQAWRVEHSILRPTLTHKVHPFRLQARTGVNASRAHASTRTRTVISAHKPGRSFKRRPVQTAHPQSARTLTTGTHVATHTVIISHTYLTVHLGDDGCEPIPQRADGDHRRAALGESYRGGGARVDYSEAAIALTRTEHRLHTSNACERAG